MSKSTQPRSWTCPTWGAKWRFTQDGMPEEVMCICDVDEFFKELGMVDEEPEGVGSSYKRALCPYCGRWHKLPPDALLPSEFDCRQSKQQRTPGRVSKPDLFGRFIEDELDVE